MVGSRVAGAEDLTGRVAAKLRSREIEQYAPLLAAGEPVLVIGKVSFPQRPKWCAILPSSERVADRSPQRRDM